MTFPFTVDERGLAHVDEATRIREFFAREGTPISRQDAQRLAFLSWCVFRKRVCEWPSEERQVKNLELLV